MWKAQVKTKLIGITGGIGAGKSAVSAYLSAKGYPVLSADELAREVTATGSEALKEIRQLFGEGSRLPDGSLNRAFVRSEILKDEKKRKALEAITHPRIQALSKQKSAELAAQGHKVIFYEAPLLFEAKSDRNMDAVLCVYAEDGKRIRRVMDRDGSDHAHAEKLLKSQMPQEEKMKRSDFLLENNGTLKELEKKIEALLPKMLA